MAAIISAWIYAKSGRGPDCVIWICDLCGRGLSICRGHVSGRADSACCRGRHVSGSNRRGRGLDPGHAHASGRGFESRSGGAARNCARDRRSANRSALRRARFLRQIAPA